MTLSVALVQVGLRIGRWILPLVAVVVLSATLAFAADKAKLGDSASEDSGSIVTAARCAPTDGSYVDTVILTESRKIDCGWAPRLASR